MSIQILDYSLASLKIPGIPSYPLVIGNKKKDGRGLTVREITKNQILFLLNQRSFEENPDNPNSGYVNRKIMEDSFASPIEYDATFSIGSEITFQLDDPAYEGQELTIVASYVLGDSSTIILGVSGTPKEYFLRAGGMCKFIAINNIWIPFRGRKIT